MLMKGTCLRSFLPAKPCQTATPQQLAPRHHASLIDRKQHKPASHTVARASSSGFESQPFPNSAPSSTPQVSQPHTHAQYTVTDPCTLLHWVSVSHWLILTLLAHSLRTHTKSTQDPARRAQQLNELVEEVCVSECLGSVTACCECGGRAWETGTALWSSAREAVCTCVRAHTTHT